MAVIHYYLQKSYRTKVDPKDSGKIKGTGKSKVASQTIYLGTAESIKNRLLTIREPLEIKNKHFGFVTAQLSVAEETWLSIFIKGTYKREKTWN